MLLDRQNLWSYQQAITVSAPSTDIVDLGPNHWAGASGDDRDIDVMIAVDQVFAAAGAATLQVDVQSSNDSAFGSGVKTHYSRVFQKAELIQSGKLDLGIDLPPDVLRYVRANYTVGTGPFTAGKLTMGVTASRQTNS